MALVFLLCRVERTAEQGERAGRRLTVEEGYGRVREISVILFCYLWMKWRGVLRCDFGWREGGLGGCMCGSRAVEGVFRGADASVGWGVLLFRAERDAGQGVFVVQSGEVMD